MHKSSFTNIVSVLSIVLCIVGIVFFFINPIITVICGVFSALNSIIQILFGEQNGLTTEVITIAIAAVIAKITNSSTIIAICFGLCIIDLLFSIIGWSVMFFTFKRRF